MTGLRVDFGVNAFQEVVTVIGPSVPVTARTLSAPSCSVAEGVTEDGAIDDSADIPAARDGMTPHVGIVRSHLSLGYSSGERAEL